MTVLDPTKLPHNSKKYTGICPHCKVTFYSTKPRTKYCSKKCCTYASIERKQNGLTPALTKAELAAENAILKRELELTTKLLDEAADLSEKQDLEIDELYKRLQTSVTLPQEFLEDYIIPYLDLVKKFSMEDGENLHMENLSLNELFTAFVFQATELSPEETKDLSLSLARQVTSVREISSLQDLE